MNTKTREEINRDAISIWPITGWILAVSAACFLIWGIVKIAHNEREFYEKCVSKGGFVYSPRGGEICLKKDSVIL